MLAVQRQSLILREVAYRGGARLHELTRQLGVSAVTVRRDLDVLAARGLLDRVHGGAVPHGAAYQGRPRPLPAAAVATAAARLVRPKSVIAITDGPIGAALATLMADTPDLTVVTNSLSVSKTLHTPDSHHATAVLTGGTLIRGGTLVGSLATDMLGSARLDCVFLDVRSLDPVRGFTDRDLFEAQTVRAMVAAGRQLIALIGPRTPLTRSLTSIAPLSAASLAIVDPALPTRIQHLLAASIAEVIVAPPDVPARYDRTARRDRRPGPDPPPSSTRGCSAEHEGPPTPPARTIHPGNFRP